LLNPASIAALAKKLITKFPNLNVLINNAGIMQLDNAAANIDDVLLTSTLTTNLLGPIRTENKQITVQTAVSKVGSSDRRFSLLPVETTLLSLQL
jgi:short-subunit dehydrogenase involved in D-alanine esterification of teichoic acids